ncbi:hypothetical protein N0V88_006926 [Collariella sp. IMI 366227]|nr:hypothetical protein N0V88_006926 [Collariella sp. IMI 366227]
MSKQSSLGSFRFRLQDHISLDDREWKFQIPILPSPQKLDQSRLVKTVSLINTGGKSEIVLTLARSKDNRAIQGIVLQGVHYNFYGHSNSQLKSRTCYLYAAPRDEISRRIESLGDFAKMKTVGKKAKCIGLLFSTAKVAITIQPGRVEDIPDIETADYIFTDGCGLIVFKPTQDLARRVGIVFRDRRYTPSVFQIRYRGYKRVVTVDPTMDTNKTVFLKMRRSMKKFAGGDDYSFSVVEHSKSHTYGYLNDEVIVLLHALGVNREIIKKKQEGHFGFLADASRNPPSAFRFLSYLNMPHLAEKVLLESLDSVRSKVQGLIKNEYAKMLNKRGEQKCRILIPKSRLLFGVCDAWDVLKEGECAVKVTMDGDRQPSALKGCEIDVIPATLSRPTQYPGVKEPLRFKPITDDDRLEYFARYTNASLGVIKNLYLDWARACGLISEHIPQKLENAPLLAPDALDEAKKKVQNCGIIFTTCIGAGLDLLRSQYFDIVIIDEASQKTEPASLVSLVKGCQKAILVGDHVQLRPIVHQHSLAMEFDKSLFERLFVQPTTTIKSPSPLASPSFLSCLMLDTQYRMHPSICAFSSTEFYGNKLLTDISPTARPSSTLPSLANRHPSP